MTLIASGINLIPDNAHVTTTTLDLASYPARACTSRSYVIRAGVHLYIYMYVCVDDPPKRLNGTLAVDLSFQTLAVDVLVEFID